MVQGTLSWEGGFFLSNGSVIPFLMSYFESANNLLVMYYILVRKYFEVRAFVVSMFITKN